MSAKLTATALAGTLFLAACASGIPLARPDIPPPTQSRMMAAYHWERLAQSVADELDTRLGALDARIYVAASQPSTPFSVAFHDFLTEALHERGIVAAAAADGAMVMSYDVSTAIGHRGDQTYTDLIVSTQVVDAGDVLFKSSDIFYVNPTDVANYVQPPPAPVIETRPRLVRLSR